MSKKKQNKKDPEPPQQQKQAPPQSIMKKMITRSIVGTGMMLFFYSIIVTKPFLYIPCFVFLLQVVSFSELLSVRYKEAKEKHLILFRTQCWFWATIFFIGFYGKGMLSWARDAGFLPDEYYILATHYHLWCTYTLGIGAFITFILTLQKGLYKYQFSQLSWTVLILVLLLGNLQIILQNMSYGLFWMVFPSTLIICNDCMAYFCGIALGKKLTSRPFIHLSPNKTWEGFVGAFFCTLVFSWLMSGFLSQFPLLHCPADILKSGLETCDVPLVFIASDHPVPDFFYPIFETIGVELPKTLFYAEVQIHALALATVASLIAPFGGFFASGMKRAFGLKDFGDYFPGHGGVFDRMDCQLLMHGSVYVYIVTFVRVAYMDRLSLVVGMVDALSLADQTRLLQILSARLS